MDRETTRDHYDSSTIVLKTGVMSRHPLRLSLVDFIPHHSSHVHHSHFTIPTVLLPHYFPHPSHVQ